MPKFSIVRKMPYSADQLYAVAADIESYPKFIPLVRSAKVLSRNTAADGSVHCEARLEFAYGKMGIHEAFTSQVVADPATHKIKTSSSDGPMKKLEGEWTLHDLAGGGAEVHYKVDYALKSKVLQIVLSGMFDLAVRKLLSAFEKRANQLYGSKAA